MVDGATVPLKVLFRICYEGAVRRRLSDRAKWCRDHDRAISVLMKDACAGMNSIFAFLLSACSIFTLSDGNPKSRVDFIGDHYSITIVANFIRVIALVLIAYYGGSSLSMACCTI